MLRTSPWVYEAIARLVVDVTKVFILALGFTILVGGPERMSSPVYAALIAWAPWWFWGGSLVGAGLLTFVPMLVLRVIGYWVAAVWMWVWWAALTVNIVWESYAPAAPVLPKPGLTGLATYLYHAVIVTALAVASLMDWRERSGHVHESQ